MSKISLTWIRVCCVAPFLTTFSLPMICNISYADARECLLSSWLWSRCHWSDALQKYRNTGTEAPEQGRRQTQEKNLAANSSSTKEEKGSVCKKKKTKEERPVSYLCTVECELSREGIDGKTKKRKTERKWQTAEEGLKGRESGECAIPPQLKEAVWEKTGANTQSTEEQTSHFTFTEYG